MDPEPQSHIEYIVLLDFQATCDEHQTLKPCQQIIEITGSIFYIADLKHTNNFHQFVRPKCNPKLTQFCKKYTSISQHQIKEAQFIDSVLINLTQWFEAHKFLKQENYTIGTWGEWSLMKCLKKQCQTKKLEIPPFIHSFTNLKSLARIAFDKDVSLDELKGIEQETTKGQGNINKLFLMCVELVKKQKDIFKRKHINPIRQIPNITISQSLQYLLVLDFEATCEENVKLQPCSEIIEFPVMIVDLKKQEVVNVFHEYVTPKYNKKLTKFCTQLTGITQEMVNNKLTLPETLAKLDKWIQNIPYLHSRNFTFVTCGDWDLATCLRKECREKDLLVPEYLKNYINIKKAFTKCVPQYNRSMGMMGMLKALNVEHEGRHHSGIDDVKNICNICVGLMKKGLEFRRQLISYVK